MQRSLFHWKQAVTSKEHCQPLLVRFQSDDNPAKMSYKPIPNDAEKEATDTPDTPKNVFEGVLHKGQQMASDFKDLVKGAFGGSKIAGRQLVSTAEDASGFSETPLGKNKKRGTKPDEDW